MGAWLHQKHEKRVARIQEQVGVVSEGGYLATVNGRTTCAPCKVEWPSVALVLTSACTVVVGYSMVPDGLPTCGHAFARLWTTTIWLGRPNLIFSLVLFYCSTLTSYVYNCAKWQRRTPPA